MAENKIFEMRKEMLRLLYHDLFFSTKDISSQFKITMNEAYKHMKWLENHDLVYGEAQNGTGTNLKRGTYRTNSILWEPVYSDERDGNWEEVVNLLKKAMKIEEKIEKMIEYVCAVCGKVYKTKSGISNHMNKLEHFEGYKEEFSVSKSERELKRIEEKLKLDLKKISEDYYGYEVNHGKTTEGYYVDYSGKNGVRTRVFFDKNNNKLYDEKMR